MERLIRLTIEYDGSRYVGWQFQPTGDSIQEQIEAALARILGTPVRLHSSGRTDAGVHARGMVAHFSTESQIPLRAFCQGVNRFLPDDIAVRAASEVPPGFHARFSAIGKWYRYSLYRGEIRSPLVGRRAWHLHKSLDLAAMRLAATELVGRHDFAAFRSSGCDAKTTSREIFAIAIIEEGELLHLDIRGSGFLRNMVRILAGTLVEIGRGERPVADITRLLRAGDRTRAGVTAPACGLCLMEVFYPEEKREEDPKNSLDTPERFG